MEKEREINLINPLLVHVTTIPETFGFFRGQIDFMKKHSFRVHGVASPGSVFETTAHRENILMHAINMPRYITPWRDLASLFKLWNLFRKLNPDIVHAHTPKGGLLGVIAARLAKVPVVIYGMHGLPFENANGTKRFLLSWSEKIACLGADKIITVGKVIRRKALKYGFCKPDKIMVLGAGSVNGVDGEGRFNPEKFSPLLRNEMRQKLKIPEEALVLGFIGRIVRDKGILELAEAWDTLKDKYKNIYLLLIGPIEPQDPIPAELLANLKKDDRVRFTGYIEDIPPFYLMMDINVLPTYREGFPVSPLEAAAMKVPVVATDVDGCPEAVEDGLTGIVVPPKNSRALSEAIEELINNSEKRYAMGQAGRKRVLEKFQPEIIWQALFKTYIELLKQNNQSHS